MRGEGDAGPKGGPAGDLYVFLKVTSDPRFRRDSMDIYSDVKVSYLDAILGRCGCGGMGAWVRRDGGVGADAVGWGIDGDAAGWGVGGEAAGWEGERRW